MILGDVPNGTSDSLKENKSKHDGVEVAATSTASVLRKEAADELLARRRKSFIPMSSMEEENLRERLHLAQLKQCSNIVLQEPRYTRDNFKRLFQSKVI